MRVPRVASMPYTFAVSAMLSACATSGAATAAPIPGAQPVSATAVAVSDTALPAGQATVADRVLASPRHGEWAMIQTAPGDSVRAWVVYPERATRAPVVVVVHEIFGLTAWVRGVADQLAKAGFIAIAPDLLTGKAPLQGDTLPHDVAVAAIRSLSGDDVQRQLAAVGRYGMSLPAALPRYGIVGFCWGGGISFAHAVQSPSGLGASVVYYGVSPDTSQLPRIQVPVLGLYGGDDARVDATVPAADSVMKRLGKSFDPHFFPGAGHGFLRAQEGRAANAEAARQAWPMTIAFFRRYLEQ